MAFIQKLQNMPLLQHIKQTGSTKITQTNNNSNQRNTNNTKQEEKTDKTNNPTQSHCIEVTTTIIISSFFYFEYDRQPRQQTSNKGRTYKVFSKGEEARFISGRSVWYFVIYTLFIQGDETNTEQFDMEGTKTSAWSWSKSLQKNGVHGDCPLCLSKYR